MGEELELLEIIQMTAEEEGRERGEEGRMEKDRDKGQRRKE